MSPVFVPLFLDPLFAEGNDVEAWRRLRGLLVGPVPAPRRSADAGAAVGAALPERLEELARRGCAAAGCAIRREARFAVLASLVQRLDAAGGGCADRRGAWPRRVAAAGRGAAQCHGRGRPAP
jgi:hypothetical protein